MTAQFYVDSTYHKRTSRMISRDSLLASIFTAAVAAASAGVLWWDATHPPSSGSLSVTAQPAPETAAAPLPASMAPTLANEQSVPTRPGIYRCESGGRTAYQATPCPGAAKQSELGRGTMSIVTGPSASEQLARIQALRGPTNAPPSRGSVAMIGMPGTTSDLEERCAALHREVKWIDAMGRRPNTSQSMEWLRERRRAVKDEMWQLKCGFPPS